LHLELPGRNAFHQEESRYAKGNLIVLVFRVWGNRFGARSIIGYVFHGQILIKP